MSHTKHKASHNVSHKASHNVSHQSHTSLEHTSSFFPFNITPCGLIRHIFFGLHLSAHFPHPQFDEQEFVKKAPWAHLDIAGPVWDDKKGGATGFAVRTLVRFVEGKAK